MRLERFTCLALGSGGVGDSVLISGFSAVASNQGCLGERQAYSFLLLFSLWIAYRVGTTDLWDVLVLSCSLSLAWSGRSAVKNAPSCSLDHEWVCYFLHSCPHKGCKSRFLIVKDILLGKG